MFAPMCRPITRSAPKRPKIAPDAPTTGVPNDEQRHRHRSAERAQQVERQEPPSAEQRLEAPSDHPQREHVQAEMPEALSARGCREQPPRLERARQLGIQRRREEEQCVLDGRADTRDQRAAGSANAVMPMIAYVTIGRESRPRDRARARPPTLRLLLRGRLRLLLIPQALRADHADRAPASGTPGRSSARTAGRARSSADPDAGSRSCRGCAGRRRWSRAGGPARPRRCRSTR